MITKNNTYTYREICEIRKEKIKSGNSKEAQLKEWKRHFKWEYPINPKTKKPSKKFLITEVYETPLDKIDGRVNNGGARENAGRKGIYADSMKLLVRLLTDDKKTQFYTKSEILAKSGVVPQFKYHLLIRNDIEEDEDKEIKQNKIATNQYIADFQSKFFGAFRTSCNNAYKQNIDCSTGYIIYNKNQWKSRRLATEEEVKWINNKKQKVLRLLEKEIRDNNEFLQELRKHCKEDVDGSTLELTEGILFRCNELKEIFNKSMDDETINKYNGLCCKCFIFSKLDNNKKLEEIDELSLYFLQEDMKNIFSTQMKNHLDATKKIKRGNIEYCVNKFKDINNNIFPSVLKVYDDLFN